MEIDSATLDSGHYAQRSWFYKFERQPYTSFWMIDHLIKRANAKSKGYSYEDFLKNPKSLKQVISETDIQDYDSIRPMEVTSPGRCTSFAIQTANEIALWKPRSYDFQFYDLGRHRVARCSKTGILIDSSSSVGAFILNEGQWKSFDGQTRWKWNSGVSKFEMLNRNGETIPKSSPNPISKMRCMEICLFEVLKDPTPLCYFRDFVGPNNDQAQFYGFLKWQLKDHKLELTGELKAQVKKDPSMSSSFVFDEQGTSETELKCHELLLEFLGFYGGANAREQWSHCVMVHQKIWAAAKSCWGYPRVLQVGSSAGKSTKFRDIKRGPDSLTDFD